MSLFIAVIKVVVVVVVDFVDDDDDDDDLLGHKCLSTSTSHVSACKGFRYEVSETVCQSFP